MAATRLSLRTNARARADQDSSTFPTDAQYNVYVDRAAAAVWRRLIAAGWLPSRIAATVTATGAVAYNVGSDVHTVLSVHFVSGGVRYPLRRVKSEDLPYLLTMTGQASCYDMLGGTTGTMQIELYPVPPSGTYEVRYIPRFAGFSADGDVWNGPDGSDELIELAAAIRGVKKEDGDPRLLIEEYKDLWQDVIAGAHWLDTPETVRDNRTQGDYLPFDYNVIGEDL